MRSMRLSVIAASAIAVSAQHSPAFFWSARPIEGLTGADRATHMEATAADLERTVAALTGAAPEGGDNTLFAGRLSPAPEVQLVFLADGLATDTVRKHGGKLTELDMLMTKSASSLTAPFTLRAEAELFANAKRVSAAEAEAHFKAHPALFTNGAPDVIVVELQTTADMAAADILAQQDALIGRISRAVDAGTRGNYAALLTAGAARGNKRMLAKSSFRGAPYLYTTPTLLTAQLIMLLLIIIFLAVCLPLPARRPPRPPPAGSRRILACGCARCAILHPSPTLRCRSTPPPSLASYALLPTEPHFAHRASAILSAAHDHDAELARCSGARRVSAACFRCRRRRSSRTTRRARDLSVISL